ncbi:MAG TPA: hypothetical protein VGM87_00635 [Roseomonas sp.]|jgi:hypothetical protein
MTISAPLLSVADHAAPLHASHADPDPLHLRGRTVLFLDDFTRSDANGLEHHLANRLWLRSLLGAALVDAGASLRDWQGDGHPAAVREFMALLGLSSSPEGWAATSAVDPLPVAAAQWLETHMAGAELVIGFELPVFLMRFLGDRGTPFLDVAIDPIRFGRDLFLAVRTNDVALESVLRLNAVDEEIVRIDAALLRANAIRQAGRVVGDPAARIAVFFGQTRIDRALVRGGRLARPADCLDRIAEVAKAHDLLLVRPHPFEADRTLLRPVLEAIPNARITLASSYALLACENVRETLSLSSSLITEAPYFGMPATALLVPDVMDPRLVAAGICSRSYRLDTGLLTADFWHGRRTVLPTVPDMLRHSLGSAWGLGAPLTLNPPPPPVPPSLPGRILRRGAAALRGLLR